LITKHTDIARILPSFLYNILAQNYIDYEWPRHIFIETTSKCNLTCEYCPREKRDDQMPYEVFQEIIEEASHYGPRSFSLHLFGEPLLYPRIIEAIRYIKNKNKRHTVLLTTNGTLLNKFAKDLEASGVDRIIWSYRKNNFNSDSISLLKKRGLIRLLIEECPKEEFDKWKKFPRVEIKHLHNYGGNIDVSKWGISSDMGNRWPCYHLWLAPAVRWNGEITLCCNIPRAGDEVLGSYGKTSIRDVWRSDRLLRLREAHVKGDYPDVCKRCDSWKAYPDMGIK